MTEFENRWIVDSFSNIGWEMLLGKRKGENSDKFSFTGTTEPLPP